MTGIWVAVNPQQMSLHVLEHEGDYNDGDILVHITATSFGVTVETRLDQGQP